MSLVAKTTHHRDSKNAFSITSFVLFLGSCERVISSEKDLAVQSGTKGLTIPTGNWLATIFLPLFSCHF